MAKQRTRAQIRCVPSYPEYGASRDGRIWRIVPSQINQHQKECPYSLTPQIHPNGVAYVTIYTGTPSRQRPTKIAHLVAECFLGPRHGRRVDHKNGDQADNRLVNLAYRENLPSVDPRTIRRRKSVRVARMARNRS